ncbi:Retrovirus-related Pol polyprotein from transposon TNT 1-94-like protein, partial [Drosera capensis]
MLCDIVLMTREFNEGLLKNVLVKEDHMISMKATIRAICDDESRSEMKLCHMRVAYIVNREMYVPSLASLLGGLKTQKLGFYEGYVLDKKKILFFGGVMHITRRTLDNIRSDLWELSPHTSIGDKKEFLNSALERCEDRLNARLEEWSGFLRAHPDSITFVRIFYAEKISINIPQQLVSEQGSRSRNSGVNNTCGGIVFWVNSVPATNSVPADRQALGVVRLTLAKNVAYNIVNEKTTYGLIHALSNMYEKSSASNKVFLIRQLVNTKMREGACVTDHVNEFNSILSRLTLVQVVFDDEIQTLLLLSSLPDSWSGTVTAVASTSGTTKLTFNGIRDLILNEDIRRRNSGETAGSLLSTDSRGRKSEKEQSSGRGRSRSKKRGQSKPRKDTICWNCQKKGHFRRQCTAPKEMKPDTS